MGTDAGTVAVVTISAATATATVVAPSIGPLPKKMTNANGVDMAVAVVAPQSVVAPDPLGGDTDSAVAPTASATSANAATPATAAPAAVTVVTTSATFQKAPAPKKPRLSLPCDCGAIFTQRCHFLRHQRESKKHAPVDQSQWPFVSVHDQKRFLTKIQMHRSDRKLVSPARMYLLQCCLSLAWL